jgi:hypothetical protein
MTALVRSGAPWPDRATALIRCLLGVVLIAHLGLCLGHEGETEAPSSTAGVTATLHAERSAVVAGASCPSAPAGEDHAGCQSPAMMRAVEMHDGAALTFSPVAPTLPTDGQALPSKRQQQGDCRWRPPQAGCNGQHVLALTCVWRI